MIEIASASTSASSAHSSGRPISWKKACIHSCHSVERQFSALVPSAILEDDSAESQKAERSADGSQVEQVQPRKKPISLPREKNVLQASNTYRFPITG